MPRLTSNEQEAVSSMLRRGGFTLRNIAAVVGCSIPTIVRMRENLEKFGRDKSAHRRGGRLASVTLEMRDTLRVYLSEHSDRYLEEMRALLFDIHGVLVSTSTISRSLSNMCWSKKMNRRRAKERKPDLRDFYMDKVSNLRSWQLVFIDETGCDGLVGFRKKGWRRFKLQSSIEARGSRSCPHTAKTCFS